jgi:glucosamine--fructose-6-phosphate aminotransferase (isomerizing)
MKEGLAIPKILQKIMKEFEGTFAILLFEKGSDTLYTLKRDSPLALGICKDKYILASDIYAFSDETNKAIFFEDNEYAILKKDTYTFYNKDGKEIQKEIKEFDWTREEETLESFPHYMIKEIKEQPEVSKRLINSFTTTQENALQKVTNLIKKKKKIVFVSSGTSYHASLIGAILLSKQGYNARTIIASEVETFLQFDKDTLCIAISQSGETMDVIEPLKNAKKAGATIASIVNVPYSTIQRLSEVSVKCLAGQEICVASTKVFTNQVIVLLQLAKMLGYKIDLENIPKKIQKTIALNEDAIKKLAQELHEKQNIFVLGRALSYPMAREIALKLKEIPYIHAEGMMAGELKHGTIALIEKGTPVITLIPNGNLAMLSSTKEVEARGGNIIAISNTKQINGYTTLHVPESDDAEFAIYSCIVGHLLSYYIAVLRGCEIDKPRNLAKCCTVK